MNLLETAEAVLAELNNRYGADWEGGKWKNAQAWMSREAYHAAWRVAHRFEHDPYWLAPSLLPVLWALIALLKGADDMDADEAEDVQVDIDHWEALRLAVKGVNA